MELYIGFNSTRFASDTERVLWTVTLFRGAALNWVEGFVQDYLKNHNNGAVSRAMQKDTIEIFHTFDGFKEKLMRVFGEVDEKRQASREVQSLKQRGSAATYTAEFQRNAVKTGWNDEALKEQYYRGLKDAVKDDIAREERPEALEDLIELAIKIDNRNYERALEKRGHYNPGTFRGTGRNHRSNNGPQPMELDATGRQELTPQEKQKHMQERLCFNCGKPGHMARNCKSGKGRDRNNTGRRRELNVATRQEFTGPMQLNATGVEGSFTPLELKDAFVNVPLGEDMQLNATQQASDWGDDFETINQSLAAVKFVETEGNDVNSESTDNEDKEDSSSGSEMSREEFMTAQILAGAKGARKFYNDEYAVNTGKTQYEFRNTPDDPWMHIARMYKELDHLGEYKLYTFHLVEAVEQQVAETDDAATLGITRSQQYQDLFGG